MKLTLSFLSAALLLGACSKPGATLQSDADIRKFLPGNWIMEAVDPFGEATKSTITIASDGRYVCQVTHGTSNPVYTAQLEGTLQVIDGVLSDTQTQNRSAKPPFPVSRAQVLRANDRELVVRFDRTPGVPSSAKPTVFRKITNESPR